MQNLKARINRIERKTGVTKEDTIVLLMDPYACIKDKTETKLYKGCNFSVIIGDQEPGCDNCKIKDICGQNRPERFKKLWEKNFKRKECKTCTEKKGREQCGILELEKVN